MNRRPLVNTRDEPHADSSQYRRFHVILGDANMSEWATALKIGTTALVLDLIERGAAPQLEIAQPIDATKSISRDQTYDWIIELTDGRKISAIDVQRIYLAAAAKAATQEHDEEVAWLLREWEAVLNDLDRDVQLCRDRVDWVAKKAAARGAARRREVILDAIRGCNRSTWNITTSRLRAGLYYELLGQGTMRPLCDRSRDQARHLRPPGRHPGLLPRTIGGAI